MPASHPNQVPAFGDRNSGRVLDLSDPERMRAMAARVRADAERWGGHALPVPTSDAAVIYGGDYTTGVATQPASIDWGREQAEIARALADASESYSRAGARADMEAFIRRWSRVTREPATVQNPQQPPHLDEAAEQRKRRERIAKSLTDAIQSALTFLDDDDPLILNAMAVSTQGRSLEINRRADGRLVVNVVQAPYPYVGLSSSAPAAAVAPPAPPSRRRQLIFRGKTNEVDHADDAQPAGQSADAAGQPAAE